MDANNISDKHELSSTDLAFERTLIAEERILMAWIRTTISLISFGFTIYKFFQEAEEKREVHHVLSPRVVGMIMIVIGMIGLLLAQIDHYYATRGLKNNYRYAANPWLQLWQS